MKQVNITDLKKEKDYKFIQLVGAKWNKKCQCVLILNIQL